MKPITMTDPAVSTDITLASEPSADDEVGLFGVANVLLRRWTLVAGLPLLAALLAGAVSLLVPPTFTATTSFVPEVRQQNRLPAGLSGLTGIAGQLGISIGADANQSPRFYADVVKSQGLMERVLLAKYPDPRSGRQAGDSISLLQLLRVKGRSPADSLERGLKELDELVSARVDNLTNIVRLSVDSRYPALAAAVASRFVAYLNEFNATTRQSQARQRRRFVEQRIADGEAQLRAAEEDLRRFYERNRGWQDSPQLVFEEGRLRRQVDIRRDVYLTLNREYETARIEEVNDTPVLTVIDAARVPQERSKPKPILVMLLALVFGGVVGVFAALGAEYLLRVRRREVNDYQEFRTLLQRARRAIGQAFRPGARRRHPTTRTPGA